MYANILLCILVLISVIFSAVSLGVCRHNCTIYTVRLLFTRLHATPTVQTLEIDSDECVYAKKGLCRYRSLVTTLRLYTRPSL
jgi:hypothetical protein